MKSAIQILIEKYNKQWEKYGMGSSISYSELIADLEQSKEIEKEQKIEFAEKYANSDAFYCSGEFDIEKGAEQYYNETFKSE